MKPVTLIPEIDNALSFWGKGTRTMSSFYALVLPIVRKFGGKFAGRGSSRQVYSLGNGRVLKFRYKGCWLCGYTQNEVEVKANKHRLLKEFVPKIYGVFKTKSGRILAYVTDEVKILKSDEDLETAFNKQFGVDTTILNLLGDDCLEENSLGMEVANTAWKENNDKAAAITGRRFIKAVYRSLGADGFSDLENACNWGMLNGKLVIADYGYVRNLW